MISRIRKLFVSDSIKGKCARGGMTLACATGVGHALRLGRNMILARLLVPADFGLMAMVIAAAEAFEAFTEVGVRLSVIQNPRGAEPEFLNVAWWFSALRAAGLFVCAFFAAPLVCWFYNEPRLLPLLRVSFLAILFNGLISPRVYVLQKEFRFGLWAILTQTAAVISVALAIIAGFYLRSAWTLVAAFTAEPFVRTLLSYALCPFIPRLHIDRAYLRELTRFAKGMAGLPILSFIYLQADVFFIGKLLTMEQLGVYALVSSTARMILVGVARVIDPLMLPAFSAIQQDQAALRRAVLKVTEFVALFGMPLIALLMVCSRPVLRVAYGAAYAEAAPVFAVMCLSVLTEALGKGHSTVYVALGRPQLHRLFCLVRAGVLVGTIYPMVRTMGVFGASVSVFASLVLSTAGQLLVLSRLIRLDARQWLRRSATGLPYSAVVAGPALAAALVAGTIGLPSLVAGSLALAVAWGLAAASVGRLQAGAPEGTELTAGPSPTEV